MNHVEKLEALAKAIRALRGMYPDIQNRPQDGGWRRNLAYCRGYLWGAVEIIGYNEALNKMVHDEIAFNYTDPSNR